jgi:hypothetical protein
MYSQIMAGHHCRYRPARIGLHLSPEDLSMPTTLDRATDQLVEIKLVLPVFGTPEQASEIVDLVLRAVRLQVSKRAKVLASAVLAA